MFLIFIQEKWTQSTEVQSDLNPAGVQHHPHPLAHGLGWQIPGKLGADRPSIAMSSGDLKFQGVRYNVVVVTPV